MKLARVESPVHCSTVRWKAPIATSYTPGCATPPVTETSFVPRELAVCAIRFSLGRTTTGEDVTRALAIVAESVRSARAVTNVAS